MVVAQLVYLHLNQLEKHVDVRSEKAQGLNEIFKLVLTHRHQGISTSQAVHPLKYFR